VILDDPENFALNAHEVRRRSLDDQMASVLITAA